MPELRVVMTGLTFGDQPRWHEDRLWFSDWGRTKWTRHNVAVDIGLRGHYGGAEAELRKVLVARLRVLGPDHPDTLATRHEIAGMMSEQGDHAGTEAEFREILASLRMLGPDHPATLTHRQEVANATGSAVMCGRAARSP